MSFKDTKKPIPMSGLLYDDLAFVLANQNADKLESAQKEVARIIEIGNLKKDDYILDLFCGQGNHSLELAQLGYKVLGLDISPTLIVEAVNRQSAIPASSSAVFHLGNAICLDQFESGTFDKVLLLGNSLAYVTPEDRVSVLKEAGRVLKKGGQLILDFINVEHAQINFQAKTWNKLDAKQFVLHDKEISANDKVITTKSILVSGDKAVSTERVYSEHIFGFAELSTILTEAGYAEIAKHEGHAWKEYITANLSSNFIHDTRQYYPVEVRHIDNKGRGVFATRDISIGDVVQRFSGPVMPYEKVALEDQIYVCWTNGLYTHPVTSTRYANHSCDPNCVTNSLREIVAKKPIKKGEELSFCYNLSETWDFWDPKWTFTCFCNSEKCQKVIDCYVDKFGNRLTE